MIFISGVHGVGKSYFGNLVKEKLGIKVYSASSCIEMKKKGGFTPDKLIPNIDENQEYLIMAVDELHQKGDPFILDGHFCLLNKEGEVTPINIDIFTKLKPKAIILLTEDERVIVKRRIERDNVSISLKEIRNFQSEEIRYAKKVAEKLNVPLQISRGEKDLQLTLDFIKGFITE